MIGQADIEERYELASQRIASFTGNEDESLPAEWQQYFAAQAELFALMEKAGEDPGNKELNAELYKDIVPENYGSSFCDPAYAVKLFGKESGRILSCAAAEMRSAIPFVFEKDRHALLIRMELLLELHTAAAAAFAEGGAPGAEELKEILKCLVSDYYETECEARVASIVDTTRSFAADIVRNADLSSADYLFLYGEYVTDNEIRLAEHVNSLPEDKIAIMADTWSEGYRKGFELAGKDLSKKKSVDVRYPIGFERVVRKALENFEKLGLKPVIYRSRDSIFFGRSVQKNGFYGANPNPQYDYDHREDAALVMDGQLVSRKLECMKAAFEEHKEEARVHAGPAVMEDFGGKPFVPAEKEEVCRLSAEQRELDVRQRTENVRITYSYIPGEERSFTIIAFPVPDIGGDFEEIFDAVIRINTLDYEKYSAIQMHIIDALNGAEKLHVKGKDGNRTDLYVSLKKLSDPSKQAIFENCAADVNIPLGEVFTTPVLEGTKGELYVSRVFLNGLEFRELSLIFEDGFVTEYGCGNFGDADAGRKYIEDNILFHHKRLPMGEAAIGTNTLAYVMGRKYGIEDRLPILIAEKTGPHFAVGDTCYSHAEDVAVYNPDGKEIVARDNEVSLLRKTEPEKAYFGCHTDITIPYEELGLIEGIAGDGSSIKIIENGRFVLPGTEELNKAFG